MTPLILVVEDEEDNLIALCQILRQDGYRVLEARTGQEAIAAARAAQPAAILMDLALPGMNGLDVAQLLKRDPQTAGIPIVALTGSWLGEDRERLLAAGFAGALRKPFRAPALVAELRSVLAQP